MNALTVALGAVAGFLVGILVTAVVRRVPVESPISLRYRLVEFATAVVFALFFWRVGVTPALPAYLCLAALAVALGVVDLATHRLPDVLTLPAYPIVGGLLALASLATGDWAGLVRAAVGCAGCFSLYYLLAVVAPDGMGFGDVKLSGVLGLALGWAGWATLVAGAFLGFALGGVVSLALIASRRATCRTRIPFGPFMLAGALIALLLSERVLADFVVFG